MVKGTVFIISMITKETECWSQQCSTKITSEPDKPKYNEELPEQVGPQIELNKHI